MKVRYILPARGALRISDPQPIILNDWYFYFQVDDKTDYVNKIIIEIHNVPEENWPTLYHVEQDPSADIPRFPFEVNKSVLRFNEIRDKIVNLESILSVFGLWAIDYSSMEEKWESQEGDKESSIFSGWKCERNSNSSCAAPVGNNLISRCIIAAGSSTSDFVSIAHFRLGREHFENFRYIESIRHLFFFLEYEYGEGKYSKNDLKNKFMSSSELIKVINEEFNRDSDGSAKKITEKIKQTKGTVSEEDFIDYIINLRGQIQHANVHTFKKWHPSRDEEFEYDAILLMNVVGSICYERVCKSMAAVPTRAE
jgi:hypothetical protein